MGVICSNPVDKERGENSYVQMLKTYSGGYHTQEGKCELIGVRYCEKIDKKEITINQILDDIVQYTRWHNMNPTEVQFCWLSLHLALGLCFQYDIRDKPLVRRILLELLQYSRGIDMGLYMRDLLHYEDISENNELVKKSYYCLYICAGYKISLDNEITGKLFKGPSRIVYKQLINADYCYYLDIPIGHPTLLMSQSTAIDTHIGSQSISLACESLKPEVVLILLRHGISPLGKTLEQLLATLGAVDVMEGAGLSIMEAPKEIVLECLLYCMRVVRNIVLCFKGETFADAQKEDSDRVYYVKDSAKRIIPEQHWKYPCSLKHLCRCEIRDSLLASDNLPHGVKKVPGLSDDLIKYIDLRA